tara:strand:- start:349 stop:603 length:255 start_codon:yes stop_codon:yes gene_type:complete
MMEVPEVEPHSFHQLTQEVEPKLVNQVKVEHMALEMVEETVQVLMLIQVEAALLGQLALLVQIHHLNQEMVEQEKIIVQYLELV